MSVYLSFLPLFIESHRLGKRNPNKNALGIVV